MSSNYSLAARELERLREDLRTMGKEGPEIVARLSDVARVFASPGVVRDAALAVVHARTGFEAKKVEAVAAQWFALRLNASLARSSKALDVFVKRVYPREAPLTRLRTELVWCGQPVDVGWVLGAFRDGNAWQGVSAADFQVLAEVVWVEVLRLLGDLKTWAETSSPTDVESVATLYEQAVRDAGVIGEARSEASTMTNVAYAADEGMTLRQIQRLHHAMECLRSGVLHRDINILGWEEFSVVELANRTDRLISATVAQLSLGPVRANAVRRLKTWLERWERASLLGGIRERHEPALQDAVDKFLYSEGLFPITHAEAGRGRIDTFIAESSHLRSDALTSGQPAILLELKQVTGIVDGKGAGALRKTIRDAMSQAREYSQHLAANPEWVGHEVFCVVAYDGPKRYAVADPHVTLIYLGDALPHEGATLIEIGDAPE